LNETCGRWENRGGQRGEHKSRGGRVERDYRGAWELKRKGKKKGQKCVNLTRIQKNTKVRTKKDTKKFHVKVRLPRFEKKEAR